MTSAPALQLDARLPAMAGMITAAIPGSEIRLFGSRAKGNAGPDSDIDLLITAPDSWLQTHNRYKVLAELRRQLGRSDVSLDLLLYSVSEVNLPVPPGADRPGRAPHPPLPQLGRRYDRPAGLGTGSGLNGR